MERETLVRGGSATSPQEDLDYLVKTKKLQKEKEALRGSAIFGKGTEFRAKVAEQNYHNNTGPNSGSSVPSGMSSQKAGAAMKMAGGLLGKESAEGGPTNAGEGAVQGGMQGASAGMALGPQGAIIGGAVGAATGIMKAKSAKKKAQAEITAGRHEAQIGIEEDKATRLNSALSGLMLQFGNTLL